MDALVRDAVARESEDLVHESDVDTDLEDDDDQRPEPPIDSRASSPLTPISESDKEEIPPTLLTVADDSTLPPPREPPPCTVTGGNSAQRKKKRQRKQKRQATEREDEPSKRRRASKVANADEYPLAWNIADAPCTSTGFTALRDAGKRGIPGLESLQDYTYIDWDDV